MEVKNGKENKFKKFRSYITVEPALLAVAVPFCLLSICLQNLTLEKVSQVYLEIASSRLWPQIISNPNNCMYEMNYSMVVLVDKN